MTKELELCSTEVTILMQAKSFDSQDAKAKFVVKEMEKRNGNDWACMVEPICKFV